VLEAIGFTVPSGSVRQPLHASLDEHGTAPLATPDHRHLIYRQARLTSARPRGMEPSHPECLGCCSICPRLPPAPRPAPEHADARPARPSRCFLDQRVHPPSAFIRLVTTVSVAFTLGLAIRFERQWRQRTAGLRTNVLVAVGAAAFSELGMRLYEPEGATRIIAYVVSGIGFLGAGVIVKDGTNIRGLNTAATLWCSGAVGAFSGSGLYAGPPRSRRLCSPATRCCGRCQLDQPPPHHRRRDRSRVPDARRLRARRGVRRARPA